MRISIAYIEDIGIRFPPGKLTDSLMQGIHEAASHLDFPDFDLLSIYMHLPGKENTFGMSPGVKLRLNRRTSEMLATTVMDGERYRQLTNWDDKLNACVDAVKQTIEALRRRYKMSKEDCELCFALLEETKRRGN